MANLNPTPKIETVVLALHGLHVKPAQNAYLTRQIVPSARTTAGSVRSTVRDARKSGKIDK